MSRKYSEDETKKWSEYDQTFSDPMDSETTDSFDALEKDPVPFERGVSWGANFEFQRVGNGLQTAARCGTFRHTIGCLNVKGHDLTSLNGINHKGKGVFKKVFYSCDKPSCPICFKRGWAVRSAGNMAHVLSHASSGYLDKKGIRHQGLGLIEHFIDSVPKCDYGLTFERLKAKAIKSLRSRGCLGGGLIFHAERFANFEEAKKRGVPIGYYFSPHWHCLGFLDGGYSRCRNCPNVWKGFDGEIHVKEAAKCMACSGFEGRTRREYLKEGGKFGAGLSGSGYVVKIKGARKSVFGTCWYQLNHSTLVKSKRDRVIVWWGVCSYNKLKMTKEDRVKRDSCPICGLPMQPVRRIGSVEVLGDDGWHREFEDDFLDKEGRPNWVVVMKVSSFA